METEYLKCEKEECIEKWIEIEGDKYYEMGFESEDSYDFDDDTISREPFHCETNNCHTIYEANNSGKRCDHCCRKICDKCDKTEINDIKINNIKINFKNQITCIDCVPSKEMIKCGNECCDKKYSKNKGHECFKCKKKVCDSCVEDYVIGSFANYCKDCFEKFDK